MDPTTYQKDAERTECDQRKTLARILGVRTGPDGRLVIPYSGAAGETFLNVSVTDEELVPVRLFHSAIGIMNELGELTSELQRWLFYGKHDGKSRDEQLAALRTKWTDEAGDLMWHLAEGLNALGIDMGQVMEANIAKLKARYPGAGWSQDLAQEEARDRAKEAAAQDALRDVALGGEG